MERAQLRIVFYFFKMKYRPNENDSANSKLLDTICLVLFTCIDIGFEDKWNCAHKLLEIQIN